MFLIEAMVKWSDDLSSGASGASQIELRLGVIQAVDISSSSA